MLPNDLLATIHRTRDLTLVQEGELFVSARTPDGRGGFVSSEQSLGVWSLRLDGIDVGVRPGEEFDRTKRRFGITLPSDAPRLPIGSKVVVEGVSYLIDMAHDANTEQIIRRYTASVREGTWIAQPQPDTVRDDDWPEGIPPVSGDDSD